MQDNNQSSRLIRKNKASNAKARRRLIGSIFLLIIALLILFNVSSKIKPVAIKAETIEIKSTATNTKINTSSPILESANQVIRNSNALKAASGTKSQMIESPTTTLSIESKSTPAVLAPSSHPKEPEQQQPEDILNANPLQKHTSSSNTSKHSKQHIRPAIVADQAKMAKPTPEDILNGVIPKASKPQYFVQLAVSNNKEKIVNLKSELAKSGISSKLQSSSNGDKTIYHLRIGPFNNKNKAQEKLTEAQEKLNK